MCGVRMMCALHLIGAVFENWWQGCVCTIVENSMAKVTRVINVTGVVRATIVKVTGVSRVNNDQFHNAEYIRKRDHVQMCDRV